MSRPAFSDTESTKQEKSTEVSQLAPEAESLSAATASMSLVPLSGLALPQQSSGSQAPVAKDQKPDWKSLDKPLDAKADNEFGSFSPTQEELKKHREVIDAIAGYLAAQDARPVLLYFGVGVGNPAKVFGSNPTAQPKKGVTAEDQVNPGFLQDARSQEQPYRTLSVLYQATGSENVQLTEQGDGQASITVDLRFPLQMHAIVHDYVAVAKKAARVVVLNAVTDNPYEGLLVLAKAKPKMESAYVSSYMETGRTKAYNWPAPVKPQIPPLVNEQGTAATMAQVFSRDAEQE